MIGIGPGISLDLFDLKHFYFAKGVLNENVIYQKKLLVGSDPMVWNSLEVGHIQACALQCHATFKLNTT